MEDQAFLTSKQNFNFNISSTWQHLKDLHCHKIWITNTKHNITHWRDLTIQIYFLKLKILRLWRKSLSLWEHLEYRSPITRQHKTFQVWINSQVFIHLNSFSLRVTSDVSKLFQQNFWSFEEIFEVSWSLSTWLTQMMRKSFQFEGVSLWKVKISTEKFIWSFVISTGFLFILCFMKWLSEYWTNN